MRLLAVVVAVGCAGNATTTSPAPPPIPPAPLAGASEPATRGCHDAAAGLERGTRDLRDPDASILRAMRARCLEDAWPLSAIECFADMTSDDLGRCAGKLEVAARDAMLAVLAGNGGDDRVAVAVVLARLSALKVGVESCDRFVSAVADVMRCERMPLPARVQLGTETADFWSLPTSGLPPDAQAQISAACGASLEALEREAVGAGCMP